VPPLVVGAELLVRQPDWPTDLVRVGVDAESLGRCSVVRPFRVLLREGEVLAGVSPPLADQLRGRTLMSASDYPGELRRVREDRVGGHHEAREVRRNIRARCGARVVVRVQDALGRHDSLLLAGTGRPRRAYPTRATRM